MFRSGHFLTHAFNIISYESKRAGNHADSGSDSDSSSGAHKRRTFEDDDDDEMMNFLLDPFAAQPLADKSAADEAALRKRQVRPYLAPSLAYAFFL